ncbi:MAG: hypothetical protein JG777_3079 [Clostridia bacterium]|jgi:hypothetical protein|uniref:hypothetical protein n=1 Tax=Petroclostridium xylanilyticum TaxID=1792311 RepID=UPI000B99B6E2|nr:hypothetical protein [Petroclostridium xylanilyticum]MBZ4647590.1 hypothetical protein [Clostridia bacterium]
MENRLREISEEAYKISQSFTPEISTLKTSEDVKKIALAIEEIDLKFDELDDLRYKAIRICSSFIKDAVSRVGREAIERLLQENEDDELSRKRVSVILRDIMNE